MEKSLSEIAAETVHNHAISEQAQKWVPAGTVLINKSGTTERSPTCDNCKSWIRHWEILSYEERPLRGDCAVYGCNGVTESGNAAQIFGCHVTIKGDEDQREFIAPLCQCCNNKPVGTEMILKKDVTLIWANVAKTCSKLIK